MVQFLPAALLEDVIAFARASALGQRPSDVKGRSIGAIHRAVDGDHHGFDALIVVGAADDHSLDVGRGGQIAPCQGDVVGHCVGVFRRMVSQQLFTLRAVQPPAGNERWFAHASPIMFAACSSILPRELLDKAGGELAQSIVASSKNGDRIARLRFGQQTVSDGGTVGEVLGLAARRDNG